MLKETVDFIRKTYNTPEAFIPLHEPRFTGNEKKYLNECIDSTFVSSVGKFVNKFEEDLKLYTGAKYAIATSNGTAALHVALLLAGVKRNDLVITQPLTFIATCNAIAYIGADPLFVDVDKNTLGLSADKLYDFLKNNTLMDYKGERVHYDTHKKIAACVPMHTFGFPAEIDKIVAICNEFGIPVVEDAAESIGSFYQDKHTGTFGLLGTFSFNGNKTITCGGGGAVLTDNNELGVLAKHLTTQAKIPHPWDFKHDHIGYNYRMPNINAALACAQLENLESYIENKRELGKLYADFFDATPYHFLSEPPHSRSNAWLHSILLSDRTERDAFLEYTNKNGVMTRPSWTLMNKLEMFKHCLTADLENAQFIEDRLVNIPSSVRVK
ncbi:MAG: LegC family aminotransferase [Bacteroidota bacterium]